MRPPSFALDDVRDRARGAFLGFAVGDALGATVEFMTPGEIRAALGVHREIVGGGWLRLPAGAVTDDTEMSVRIGRSIAACGRFELRAVADELVAWLRTNPVDVGNTCRRGLRRYALEKTLEGPASDGDAGNGAAMRMVPVALATLGSAAQLARLAVAQGHLTHHHVLSDAACVLVGRLVQMSCLDRSIRQLRRAADEAVESAPAFRFVPYPGVSSAYVVDTIRTVLHHVFTTRSFEACVVETVNQGGDADTAGAIAGAIAGSYYGPDSIPRRWLNKLDGKLVAELGELTMRLVELSPLARGDADGHPG